MNACRCLVCLFLFVLAPSPLVAKVVTEKVEYKDASGAVLEGFAVYDDTWKEKRPGVLVIHDWRGLTDYVQHRAEMLVALGYVAFAADIYGKGVRLTSPEEWKQEIAKYKGDRLVFRQRARAALDAMKALPQVDPARVAAIGYCFGGTGVVELARAGADVLGVVSFHGTMDRQPLSPGAKLQASILLLDGADDPYQKAEDMRAFEDQLRELKADYQMVSYSGAVHAFTDRDVDALNQPGAKYNAAADRRSWEAMADFLREIFARKN